MKLFVIYYGYGRYTLVKENLVEKRIESLNEVVHVEEYTGTIRNRNDVFKKSLAMGMLTGNRKYPSQPKEKPTIWSEL